jgi:hypothetical protein
MTEVRDHQRARVYAWEDRFVAPHDPSAVACAQAQGMVDAIWAEMGLRFPPKVVRLPRQARTTIADATRLLIRLADPTSSWCLLHELAHAMSCTHEGESDGHGRRFTGLYAQLLIRYRQTHFASRCMTRISTSTWTQGRSSWMIDRQGEPPSARRFCHVSRHLRCVALVESLIDHPACMKGFVMPRAVMWWSERCELC